MPLKTNHKHKLGAAQQFNAHSELRMRAAPHVRARWGRLQGSKGLRSGERVGSDATATASRTSATVEESHCATRHHSRSEAFGTGVWAGGSTGLRKHPHRTPHRKAQRVCGRSCRGGILPSRDPAEEDPA
eukprot:CAMPEP_0181221008 /NCGR_PEP_ID=MMETSP1096-20121128/29153_1 /TAXON_ID=156174 ORGANISM="Chrysochromulina ericina, Strain CCMP281" /NCGR_SAMPLE_ID=MMETSP1096 /ASSEMBLY_ACC=CAM_ASM_000453 /LENGTH=129 /DNA_ID=CAMNT_0023313573 /DNA_START=334 /DNA_END=719 /DNA_ORIENTATION=+